MRGWLDGVGTFVGVLSAFLASIAAVSGLIVLVSEIVDEPHSVGRLGSGWLLLAAGGLFLCSFVLRRWYRARSGDPRDGGSLSPPPRPPRSATSARRLPGHRNRIKFRA